MSQLAAALTSLDEVLSQTASTVSDRLQSGLTRAKIQQLTTSFSWVLPQDAYDLYQWHNGLSGKPGNLNLVERLLRLKGKWHGELSGRENEIHLKYNDRPVVAKFLPLDYALAGHRHLKLGRCPLDLLPISVWSDSEKTFYCMMRLDAQPTIYCADGTNLPPMRVTETFLSTQTQFSQLSDLVEFLIPFCQQALQLTSTK
ncbi:MAG: hypothetical protein N4J56_005248 [Chroococcidiopsis sp. SAG 2025]|uniref:hypothetical protein n=1 Tax=Chroococcidiopsis sp. SAG 2025 TaxID=171389 RepID=UPI0029373BA8|nr:hypothetical protein [Chroococcidiopsis sp. SAG 2025]MDV2995594.1 hypothetical protein [Chroococcidiopsis sp. SAG 2025]